MFVFQDPRRGDQFDSRRKDRLRVRHPVRFQQLQRVEKFRSDFSQVQLSIKVKNWFEVCRLEARAGELIETRAQLRNVRRWHGEPARMRVTTVTGEKTSAGLDSFQQVECTDRAAGAISL